MTIGFEKGRINPEALPRGPRCPEASPRGISAVLRRQAGERWDEKHLSARVPEAPALLCKGSRSRHLSARPQCSCKPRLLLPP